MYYKHIFKSCRPHKILQFVITGCTIISSGGCCQLWPYKPSGLHHTGTSSACRKVLVPLPTWQRRRCLSSSTTRRSTSSGSRETIRLTDSTRTRRQCSHFRAWQTAACSRQSKNWFAGEYVLSLSYLQVNMFWFFLTHSWIWFGSFAAWPRSVTTRIVATNRSLTD